MILSAYISVRIVAFGLHFIRNHKPSKDSISDRHWADVGLMSARYGMFAGKMLIDKEDFYISIILLMTWMYYTCFSLDVNRTPL